MRKTVPASNELANLRNTASDSGLFAALVHTEAVRPYGESFMSSRASSSDDTF